MTRFTGSYVRSLLRHPSFFYVVRIPAFQLPVSIHGGNQRSALMPTPRQYYQRTLSVK